MCLIIVKPQGKNAPDDETIRLANMANSDGIGIAWKKPNEQIVRIKKDYEDTFEFSKWLKENITTEDACIIHFRLRTHGLNDKGNRHPFPITRNKKFLRLTNTTCRYSVAHNGVLSSYKHKKLSDTQKFILDILASSKIKYNLKNKTVRKLLKEYIGSSKLAILDFQGNISLIGHFTEENGLFYSNKNHDMCKYYYGWKGHLGYDYENDYEHIPKIGYAKIACPNSTVSSCEICGKKKKTETLETGNLSLQLCNKCSSKIIRGTMKECIYCGHFYHINNMVVWDEQRQESICDLCYRDFQSLN